jgi:hypothetical protein
VCRPIMIFTVSMCPYVEKSFFIEDSEQKRDKFPTNKDCPEFCAWMEQWFSSSSMDAVVGFQVEMTFDVEIAMTDGLFDLGREVKVER